MTRLQIDAQTGADHFRQRINDKEKLMVTKVHLCNEHSSRTTPRTKRQVDCARGVLNILIDHPPEATTNQELTEELSARGARSVTCRQGEVFQGPDVGGDYYPLELDFEFSAAMRENLRALVCTLEGRPGWDVRFSSN